MAGTKASAGLAPSSAARRLARSACEQRVALVADRAGAGEVRGRRAGTRQHAAEPVVELGERLHLARPGPGAPRRRLGARLEAREALVHVVDEAGLAHLAVVDHVDAKLHLLVHDVPDRPAEPDGVRGHVHGPARRSRGEHLEQVDGPRKATRVGRENPVRAPVHRSLHWHRSRRHQVQAPGAWQRPLSQNLVTDQQGPSAAFRHLAHAQRPGN